MPRIRIALAAGTASVLTAAALVASAPAATTKLTATMNGAQEVPSKGDRNGSGRATITFGTSKGVCYRFTLRNVERKIDAAHIHAGKRGKAGAIVIGLFTSPKTVKRGKISGCTKGASADDVRDVLAQPGDFYVNLHTKTFPSGSVRGQLRKAS